jgi:hypothetical protein
MLLSGFPSVGLKINVTLVEGGSPGSFLIVGEGGELAQMLPMTSGIGYAEDNDALLTVDGLTHERHLVFLNGPRELVLTNQEVGQEEWLIIIPKSKIESGDLIWPAGIAWRGGAPPELEGTPGRAHLVRLLKIGDGRWLGWPDGDFF